MNQPGELPRRKLLPATVLEYGFPQAKPIFWGPNQLTKDQKYDEPSGWKFNETLAVPWIVRFCHDDRTVDSDTADNQLISTDPDPDGSHGWTHYDTACFVSIARCLTLDCLVDHYPTPNCGENTYSLLIILDKAEQEACCCTSFYTGGLPTIPSGYSYLGGYITPPVTGGTPLFNPSTPLVLMTDRECDEYENQFWNCPREANEGNWKYNGTIAGACAAGYLHHMMSITTWFWKKPDTSSPDGFKYTYTQYLNRRWLDEAQTLPDPAFVNLQWCAVREPIPPSFP